MEDKTLIGYKLEPIYKEDMTGMQTNMPMSCFVTGRILWGQGGGGDFIAPKTHQVLRTNSPLKSLIREEIESLRRINHYGR